MNAQELIDLKKKYEGALQKHGKKALVQLFKEFFESAPEVVEVTWAQYTPYFNDGNACFFGVHEFYYILKEEQTGTAKENEERDEGDEGISSYSLKGKLKKTAEAFEQEVSGLDDLFLAAFDDHVKVTVTRDGDFSTEEHSHD